MTDILTFTLNIGAALLMGTLIGIERQIRQRTAGLRTNALVALGAALFVSLSTLLHTPFKEVDPTRIASYVVSGIGFLGGGVILREGLNVRGMNTAATLWCSAAVGTLAGSGYIVHGFVGTAVVLAAHLLLRPLVHRIEAWTKTSTVIEVDALYRVRVVASEDREDVIRLTFMRHVNSEPRTILQGLSIKDSDQPGKVVVEAEVLSSHNSDKFFNDLVSRLSIEPGVTAASWERAH